MMEIELDSAIAVTRRVVSEFARDLNDDEGVCMVTRSLALVAQMAWSTYDGVWTEARSQVVEEIFLRAIEAHQNFTKEVGAPSEYRDRLVERYENLKKIFVHGLYANQPNEQPEHELRANTQSSNSESSA